jgi:hypothetical protein
MPSGAGRFDSISAGGGTGGTGRGGSGRERRRPARFLILLRHGAGRQRPGTTATCPIDPSGGAADGNRSKQQAAGGGMGRGKQQRQVQGEIDRASRSTAPADRRGQQIDGAKQINGASKETGRSTAALQERRRRRIRINPRKNWIGIKHELRVREREKAYALIPC